MKREAEWEILTHFVGHRDGLWEISTCKWDRYAFATASAGSLFLIIYILDFFL